MVLNGHGQCDNRYIMQKGINVFFFFFQTMKAENEEDACALNINL